MRLHEDRGFDHWLKTREGFLPSPQVRWCTQELKIKPFEEYVGDDLVYSYIGIRADEQRTGYLSFKKNIVGIFPFREDNIDRDDVFRILEESGAGLPDYYEWRTRSGCYFCFYQRKSEWVGLLEKHPDLFDKAKQFEGESSKTGRKFTWSQGESLEELSRPERVAEIKKHHSEAMLREGRVRPNRPLVEILGEALDSEDDSESCTICR